MGGPERAKELLLAQPDRDAKIKFLKAFPGIGPKYARNIMMDVYHRQFRDRCRVLFLSLSGTDVVAYCRLCEWSHDVGNGLEVAVFHDAPNTDRVIDVFERISGDDDKVGKLAGLKGAEVFGEAVGLRWMDGRGLKGLPWGTPVFDLSAQVQVETSCGKVEGRVGSGENEAARCSGLAATVASSSLRWAKAEVVSDFWRW